MLSSKIKQHKVATDQFGLLIGSLAIGLTSCWHDSSPGNDSGVGADADVDTDSDMDTDSDVDTDADTDADADADADADSDTDTDTDTDADSDSDTDGDTDADADTDTETGTDTGIQPCQGDECPDLIWVTIEGGTFEMGSEMEPNEQPVHEVAVPSFEMTGTEVTVAQYAECVAAFACTEPDLGSWWWWWCNGASSGHENHPMNCVDWYQAVDFCQWVGGRLPSEAEWEYAARGGGQDITYPWGDEEATCEYAVMDDDSYESGCDAWGTWAVCSKPNGNTAQGLCDMAGNVWEWVRDWWHSSYDGAPDDGSAWEGPPGSGRVLRGGDFESSAVSLRAANRVALETFEQYTTWGFRCARAL